jgi:hypothetical protein
MRQTKINSLKKDGCILWKNRIVIPPRYRQKIITEVYNTHMGKVKMKEIARNYVWWPGIRNDLEESLRVVKDAVLLKVLHIILNFTHGSGLTNLENVGILILLAQCLDICI